MHYADYKTVLSAKNGFNLYRGCTHGCIYCDSRSKCYQFTHEFEDVEVKQNAVKIFEKQLQRKKRPCMLMTGAMCDPYMPIESELNITRQCLTVIEKYGFGVSLLTKSNLILRDLDALKKINGKTKCVVQMTLTTFDEELCRILEPNVCTTYERFKTLEIMRDNGIPTTVWLCPLLPWLTDTEENVNGIMDYCVRANVKAIVCFGIGMTLREGNREYFYTKLDQHFPDLKQKYIKTFGNAYEIPSPNADKLYMIISETCKKHNILFGVKNLFTYLSEFQKKNKQLTLDKTLFEHAKQ